MLQINSMPYHIHVLIGMHPAQFIASLIQNRKTESSKWIKHNQYCLSTFAWQEGYGPFAYYKSHVDKAIRYIQNQEIHHRKQAFPAFLHSRVNKCNMVQPCINKKA